MEQEEVRALIQAHRPPSGQGYPDEVRRAAVAYAQQCRARGLHWEHIGRQIGVSGTALVNWSKAQGHLLPVAIVDELPQARPTPLPGPRLAGLVLCTPSGFRLEGLDLQQALALLSVLR
jgi:hypothetical protein